MVHGSIPKTESQTQTNTNINVQTSQQFTMAAASSTVKQHQPLHNFPLQDLKWSMNHSNNQRIRKPSSATTAVSDSSHKSPLRDPATVTITANSNENSDGQKTITNSLVSPDRRPEKKEKKLKQKVTDSSSPPPSAPADASVDAAVENENPDKKSKPKLKSSKLFIRLRKKGSNGNSNCNSSKCAAATPAAVAADDDADMDADVGEQTSDAEEEEPVMAKTWNLRPRRPVTQGGGNGNTEGASGGAQKQEIRPQGLSRPRNATEAKATTAGGDRKDKGKEKKPKFSLTLTRQEIEEDIFVLTGSKPSRRPKKRAKHIQKQVDMVSPGMWLSSITPESYKVSEHHTKS